MPKKLRSALSLKFLSVSAILATAPLAASSPANASPYTFTQLDVPGAFDTQANGINDAAQIVGTFGNGSFLDTGGSFSQLHVPGPPLGINDAGQIVGTFVISNGPAHGFLDIGGSFTQLDVPGAISTQ